jgi:hypothetical protein
VFFGAFTLGIGLDLLWNKQDGVKAALRRHLPLASGLALTLALALPVHFRHYASTGVLFPTGYQTMGPGPAESVPMWKRRSPGFYIDPCLSVIGRPYFPECSQPEARFWGLLVGTTFADYFNYSYAGMPSSDEPAVKLNFRGLSLSAISIMQASVAAGLLIAIATAAGLLTGLWRALRRRDVAIVVLCAMPILAIFGQLYFSVRYPYDGWGPVKGNYLLFASAPMFAAYGATCSWMWKRPRWRAVAALQACAVLVVAVYSIYARWHGLSE